MTEAQREAIGDMKTRTRFLYYTYTDIRRLFPDKRKEVDEMLHWLDSIWYWCCEMEKDDGAD